MAYLRLNAFKAASEVISSIMNCICPECGGSMGGRGQEFKCQGKCEKNWRQVWDEHAGGREAGRGLSPTKSLLKQ